MREIYNRLSELLEKNSMCVLATIVSQAGSSPRGPGTKMLIMEDGAFVGTIGGGKLEKRVLDAGKEVFSSLTPALILHKMQGADVDANEMICGGNAQIFLEPVLPDSPDLLNIIWEIDGLNKRGGSGILATVLDSDRWKPGLSTRMFLKAGGEKTGSLYGINGAEQILYADINEMISKRVPQVLNLYDAELNPVNILIEPVISEPVVYIFGGGHVSRQIGPIAHLVGFSVVIIDDREEFSIPETFPYAKEVITCPFDSVMERLSVNDSSYLVIVTRGHSHDKTVLAQALKTSARYIGMIGSKRKVKIIYENLLREGFTQDQLDKVYSPIGEEIGAETPEEIAVSIVAQLIRIRAGEE